MTCGKTHLTTCYFGIGVLLQMSIQHGIADLVTHLICRFEYIFSQYFHSVQVIDLHIKPKKKASEFVKMSNIKYGNLFSGESKNKQHGPKTG